MALAHVHLVHQGLDLSQETLQFLALDEPSGLLLAVKGGHVFGYDTAQPGPHNLLWTYPLQEGPPLLALRCSPRAPAGAQEQQQLLLLQRSRVLLEAVDLQSGNIFVLASHKGRAEILEFFFSDAPNADLVIVTTHGLELCQIDARRQGVRCCERIPLSPGVLWARYSHETRVCLLGLGPSGGKLRAWQFTVDAVVKLPSFQVKPAPLPSGAPAALGPGCFWVLRLYGRVYCAYLDREALRLQLYRFYTDMVQLQHSYELFSADVQLSVADSVLLVHHSDTQVVALLDVAAPTQLPIANPLPPALLPQHVTDRTQALPLPLPAAGSAAPRWRYHLPNSALEVQQGVLYHLHLDLQGVAESCSDGPLLVGFLQRRRQSAVPALAVPPRQLVLATVRTALQDRLPMATLRAMFDLANAAYSERLRTAGGQDVEAVRAGAPSVPSPEELARQVFRWLHDEEVVDAPYLQSALAEYQASAHALGLALPAALQLLAADILLQQGQQYQVAQQLYCQPSLASPQLAQHLLAAAGPDSERSGALDCVVLDALARHAVAEARHGDASAMASFVQLLLQRGELLRAVRLVKTYNLDSLVPPGALLRAAAEAGNRAVFAAVYRQWNGALQASLTSYGEALQRYGLT